MRALIIFFITILLLYLFKDNHINNDIENFTEKKIRAVVLYIPNVEIYIKELKNVYQNFENLNLWENTDLIIFHPKNFILSKESKNKMNKMIMIEYDDINEDNEWDSPIAANDCIGKCKPGKKLRPNKYSFINSFKFLIDKNIQKLLKTYKYILKTDSDIFLSPKFKNTFPDNKVMVGIGQYCNKDITKDMLKKISKKLNYNHYNIFNIGATWYGNSEDIIDLGKLSYEITMYIYKNEFLHYHPGWDDWFIGVSSMYGSEIAANHLFGKNKLEKTELLDNYSHSSEDINSVLHVHCWQNNIFYSKLQNRNGEYKDRKPISNSNKINEYIFNIVKQAELL